MPGTIPPQIRRGNAWLRSRFNINCASETQRQFALSAGIELPLSSKALQSDSLPGLTWRY